MNGDPVPRLPDNEFVVRGNGLFVGARQDIFVMPACHTHSQIELNYMLEGRATYVLAGELATIGRGDLALFWAAVPHQTTVVEPGSRYVCIYIPLEMFLNAKLTEAMRSSILAGGMIVSSTPDQFDATRLQRVAADASRIADERIAELIAAEVLLILRRLDVTGWHDLLDGRHKERHAAGGPVPDKVIEMTRFIAEHGHDEITVTDVADAARLHPNYAMTLFRTALGMTVGHYILRHRMMTAQALLITTKKGVAAVTFEAGFGSTSQFHRAFRTAFGCSPREFRRRMAVN